MMSMTAGFNYLTTLHIDWEDVEDCLYKYIPLQDCAFVFPEKALIVIDEMVKYTKKDYKYTVIDFKVRTLKAGEYGCPLPDWHYDCVKEYNHPSRHEHHIIYVNEQGTLFDKENPFQIGDGEIWEYGRDLHASPKLTKDVKRVLIRLTENDLIKGIKC